MGVLAAAIPAVVGAGAAGLGALGAGALGTAGAIGTQLAGGVGAAGSILGAAGGGLGKLALGTPGLDKAAIKGLELGPGAIQGARGTTGLLGRLGGGSNFLGGVEVLKALQGGGQQQPHPIQPSTPANPFAGGATPPFVPTQQGDLGLQSLLQFALHQQQSVLQDEEIAEGGSSQDQAQQVQP